MARIRRLQISNFRSIQALDWVLLQDAGIYVPETGRMRKEAQHKHLSAPIREWLPESDVPDIWQRLGAEIRDRPEDIAPDHYIKANPREPLGGRRRDLTQKREKPPRARRPPTSPARCPGS